MKYPFDTQESNQSEASDAYDGSRPHEKSSDSQNNDRKNVTPRHTNKKMFSAQEEERQDENFGNEEQRQQLVDDLEYKILYNEIERIHLNFQSGSPELEETTLTSTFNNEAEISQNMHGKLMRLIKAMIPNSTEDQKDSFIRDLFDMGIRVGRKSSTRLQLEREIAKPVQESFDEIMVNRTYPILEKSSNETDSVENKEDSIQQNPNELVSVYSPHTDQDLKNGQNLDDYVDGTNSIVASIDESDVPGVEMAASLNQSLSSRQVIYTQATTSSDAIDIKWEKLRTKMLSGSDSERTGSLTSEMEADLLQYCVETGLASSQTTHVLNDNQQHTQVHVQQRSTYERQDIETPNQNELRTAMSDDSSKCHQIMKDMHRFKSATSEDSSKVHQIMTDCVPQREHTEASGQNELRTAMSDDSSKCHQIMKDMHRFKSATSEDSSKVHQIMTDCVPQREDTETSGQNELRTVMSDDSSKCHQIIKDMHRFKMAEHPSQSDVTNTSMGNRPGQADDSSTYQPIQQHNIDSDSFEIDALSNTVSEDENIETSNTPSSGEQGPMDENDKISLESCDFVSSFQENVSKGNKKKEGEMKFEKHEISLRPSLKYQLSLRSSSSSNTENSKTSFDASISDSTPEVDDDESIEGSNHNDGKIVYVKSSLSYHTEKEKEQGRSFYQTVNLSASHIQEHSGSTESPNSAPEEMPPSWRLSPVDSLSDFILIVLSAETGLTTNYYVHKHMMAIGRRSSQYMEEVFASENATNFQVTLDQKTSTLIPQILDFIYCRDYDISITTDNVVALRQLAKMLKIIPLEIETATFILKDMGIHNLVSYFSDCTYFNDAIVTKAAVEMCTANIGSIPFRDRLWVVMEPQLFLQILSSPNIDRGALSKQLSMILMEYLDLHQYEINVELFATLTSENIIPVMDRTVALSLIEMSDAYDSSKCAELQKRCAFTIACYWQTTPQAERHRLFALLRNLPSSLTVDFLEIVESGNVTLDILRSEMEKQDITGDDAVASYEQETLTIQDFCGDLVADDNNKATLSWRMDPEQSYSDMAFRVQYLNHEGSRTYHVHKHILAGSGAHRSAFFAEHLLSDKIAPGEKVAIVFELDYEGSALVPQVLDYIYSRDSELDITTENSVAFHYISRAFGVPTLSKKIMEFVDKNISLENVTDYIIDGGYYRDHMTIETAGRLCAREITSIGIESKLLKELEPDFFEKVVSCDAIEQNDRSYVNVLITKYFSIRDLQGDVVQRLLKSIYVDQIDEHSALNLLKIIIKLKDYEGIETFETVKKKSIDVIIENWTELTADNHRRKELFTIFPSFTSDLLTNMFDTIDGKARKEREEAAESQQADLLKRCQEKIEEAHRMREAEVSYLKKELEGRTTNMLNLQKELEGQLIQVDRALCRRKSRSPITSMQNQNQNGEKDANRTMDIEGTNKFAEEESPEQTDDSSNDYEVHVEVAPSDNQSVSTAKVQKAKGRSCCF